MDEHLQISESQDATRERIIRVAGQIFADEGFQNTTIRTISERARVNVAAINYHFRDKFGLYTEVLRKSVTHDTVLPPQHLEDPREALGVFIHMMMSRLLCAGNQSWQMHLMAREMAQPTPALKEVIEQTIRPKSEWLRRIVAKLTNLPSDDVRVRRAAFSIVGQCMMYRIGEEVLKELWPDLPPNSEQIDQISAHILAFSLRGIDGLVSATQPAMPPQPTERDQK